MRNFNIIEIYLKSKSELFTVNKSDPLANSYRSYTGFEELFRVFKKEEDTKNKKIVIFLPYVGSKTESEVNIAINQYCDDRIRELKIKKGKRNDEVWKSMTSSMVILASFVFLTHLVKTTNIFNKVLTSFISQALFITALLSLWHPIDLLMYDRWHERNNIPIYEEIKEAKVEVRMILVK